jgi:membrane protease YdiL (CAAX protease family)
MNTQTKIDTKLKTSNNNDAPISELIIAGCLTLFCAIVYAVYFSSSVVTSPQGSTSPKPPLFNLILSTPILIIMLFSCLSLGSARVVRFWQMQVDRRPLTVWLFPTVGCLLSAIYMLATSQFRWNDAITLAVYLFIPVALGLRRALWADWGIALAISLPIQYKFKIAGYRLMDLPQMPVDGGVQIHILLAVCVTFWTLLVVRRLKDFEFRLHISREDFIFGIKLFAVFGLIIMPLGLVTHFIEWRPFTIHLQYKVPPIVYLFIPIGLYLSVALPEEVMFRGVIQNLLNKTTQALGVLFLRFPIFKNISQFLPKKALTAPFIALILNALIFGITHKKNGGDPVYYWSYAAFATLAGAFYGYAYLRTNRLNAGAVMHALVDSAWLIFFNPKGLH